ncbi:MAG: response regulator [Candidatus Moraniibacteriota bacterium]|nr:MAG: response regulator [Candidatus Moranbacteria bacterium]
MEEHPFIRPKVCVIDDDADLREIYLLNLNRENFDAVLAKDGEEGLRAIREHAPDAIILDLQMPKMNGFEVLAELSTDPKLCRIPVVILSNADDQESFKKVGQFETHFYLVKALTTPQKVVKILREVIK